MKAIKMHTVRPVPTFNKTIIKIARPTAWTQKLTL